MAIGTHSNSTMEINTILTQEANRIGSDVHRRSVHTSPWIDLIKKSTFPDGMGYQLNSLIYDRALPLRGVADLTTGGATVGVDWAALGTATSSGDAGFSTGQTINTTSAGTPNRIDFTQVLKPYSLKRAVVESPKFNIEDLRFAAHRTEQLRATMDLLTESTRNTWENRYRDEYDSLAQNLVTCQTAGSAFERTATNSGKATGKTADIAVAVAASTVKTGDLNITANADLELAPNARISNKVLDKIYYELVRRGAGLVAYGRENGRPIFSLVCSSEASNFITTESESIKDDQRFNKGEVGKLIAPLGVERSFRGFYHLIDDMTKRYEVDARVDATECLLEINPYIIEGGAVTVNPAYESATYEAAYVLVDGVMESLMPKPISGAGAISFDPIKYTGDFKWLNIANADNNPDGTIGFFRGVMASASKPLKVDLGYVVLFNRKKIAANELAT
jgi:hypothetical protein